MCGVDPAGSRRPPEGTRRAHPPDFHRDLPAPQVDRNLRAALHALRQAERCAVLWFAEVRDRRLFRELGYSSIYHYAGVALGFSKPKTAQFVRLCESLEHLPVLKRSVAQGEVSWTKAREVAKVATRETDESWTALARTESRRKLERRVSMTQAHSRSRRRAGRDQLALSGAAGTGGAGNGEGRFAMTGTGGTGSREGRLAMAAINPADAAALAPNFDPAAVNPADAAVLAPDLDTMAVDPADAATLAPDLDPTAILLGTDLDQPMDAPVAVSVRFTPAQYARYEALLEKLRKKGVKGSREEVLLASMEALLTDVEAPLDRTDVAGDQPLAGQEHRPAGTGGDAPPADKAFTRKIETPATASGRVAGAARGPVYQVIVQQCDDCGRARVQTSRGAKPVGPATAAAVRCDARVHRPGEKNKATIPPSVRRQVLARDGYRCRTPGCGSARFLEVHHVVPRIEGGSNRAENLVTLCSACHRLMHERGSAPARPG